MSDEEVPLGHKARLAAANGRLTTVRTDYCSHPRKSVNANKRIVACVQCGAVLDPIDVLFRIAADAENMEWYDRKGDARAKRVNEHERREKNLRARLKRMGEKLPDKGMMDLSLNGKIPMGIEEDGAMVWVTTHTTKHLTAEEAEHEGERLKQLAWQLRKEQRQ